MGAPANESLRQLRRRLASKLGLVTSMFAWVGTMFALVSNDTLYFKADETTRADFEAEGMDAFTYATKGGRNTLISYWRAPERLFDEPDEMLAWARKALATAQRSGTKKPPRKRRQAPKQRSR